MLKSISVNNYKAFREASFDFKPITVFLGENSVGKSSILQLLLLLKQTAVISIFNEDSPLKMYGYFAKMGMPENLFHNKDVTKPFEVSVKFSNDKISKKMMGLLRDYVVSVANISYFLPIKALLEWRSAFKGDVTERNSFYDLVKLLADVLSKEKLDRYKDNLGYAISTNSLLADWDIQDLSSENLMSIYDMLAYLKEEVKGCDEYVVSYSFVIYNKRLSIQKVTISVKECKLFCIEKRGSEVSVTSDATTLNEMQIKAVASCFKPNYSIFECFSYPYHSGSSKRDTTKSNYMLKIVELVLKEFVEEFRYTRLNHVGPLRASPKRYYVLDKESYSTYWDCSDGEAVVELLKNRDYVREKTNRWLERFGFNVNISESEDVIHHLLINQNAIDYDITDVGFGVSQILPIIVQGYLAFKDSLTIIEQPEIHLHPQMQAELANLFVDIVSYKDRNMIIETHSEYMLRRLRRLMSDPDFKDIRPKDVALYYFEGVDLEKGKDFVSIRPLEISSSGSFEWPKSFYETELDDNLAFMKNQSL